MKKGLEVQICAKIAKIGLEISFFVIFSSLVYQFSLKLYRMMFWYNV